MAVVKNYTDFIKETDVVGHDEPQATKPATLSEKLCEKIQECMEMAMAEAKEWHEDEYKEHTAEGYAAECDSYIKECMEGLMAECGNMMTQDTFNRADGGMRQDTVQDVPVMGGAMR
jgi:hypothetical protein